MRGIARRTWVLALLGACAAAARAQGPIRIAAEPVFAGAFSAGITPIIVTLQNTGPSVEGAVTVDGGAFPVAASRIYAYPVSLPTGSVKKVTVYPRASDYAASLRVMFTGSFRGRKPTLDVSLNPGQVRQVGLVGDQAGGMGALRSLTPDSGSAPMPYRDVYGTPENAPDRAAGYSSLSTLVLANGTERMNPAQWAAVRRWVMAGGSLVCAGGAGAVYLQTPGAAALLPVRNLRGASAASLTLAQTGKRPLPPGPYALMTGDPVPGASVLARQGPHVALAARRLGAGTVVFCAFSPFEAPLRGWNGAGELWRALLETGRPAVGWQTLQGISLYGAEVAPRRALPGRPIARGTNPFRVQLPPVSTVAAIFALYFVLAIPVTYLVLRKIRRLEWAWLTNPVLAGVFAFVFYLFAAHLYDAGMSRRTSGVLVSAAGTHDALFLGATQVFFPHGGNHPVMIPNAEILETTADSGRFGMPGRKQETLTTVDAGFVSAPVFPVPNLAFRNLYYVQPVELTGAVTATLRRGEDGGLSGTVRNGSAHELRDAVVVLPGLGRFATLGNLKPGQTARLSRTGPVRRAVAPAARPRRTPPVPAPAPGGPPMPSGPPMPGNPPSAGGVSSYTPEARALVRGFPLLGTVFAAAGDATPGGALLVGRTTGEAYGPQMGRYVPGTSVDVLLSLPVEGGA